MSGWGAGRGWAWQGGGGGLACAPLGRAPLPCAPTTPTPHPCVSMSTHPSRPPAPPTHQAANVGDSAALFIDPDSAAAPGGLGGPGGGQQQPRVRRAGGRGGPGGSPAPPPGPALVETSRRQTVSGWPSWCAISCLSNSNTFQYTCVLAGSPPQALELTEDHRLTNPRERQRLQAMGIQVGRAAGRLDRGARIARLPAAPAVPAPAGRPAGRPRSAWRSRRDSPVTQGRGVP